MGAPQERERRKEKEREKEKDKDKERDKDKEKEKEKDREKRKEEEKKEKADPVPPPPPAAQPAVPPPTPAATAGVSQRAEGGVEPLPLQGSVTGIMKIFPGFFEARVIALTLSINKGCVCTRILLLHQLLNRQNQYSLFRLF